MTIFEVEVDFIRERDNYQLALQQEYPQLLQHLKPQRGR